MTLSLLAPLSLVSLVLAHGGEDHGEPAQPVVSVSAHTINVAAASKAFEAVIRIRRDPEGKPVAADLLLSDYATSAPVSDAIPSLTLSGPGTAQIDFVAGTSPGAYTATATFPTFGDYAGALVVTTPQTSDLLAISGVRVGPATGDVAAPSAGWALAGVAGALVLGAGAGVVGIGVGFLIGRRRGAAAAAGMLMLTLGGQRVWAHGGVDDEGPASHPSAGPSTGTLALPMASQFLGGLRTQPVKKDTFQVEATGRFVSRPGDSATLRAPTSGVLAAPAGGFPPPGREVHAGDLLALIKETPGSADRAAVAQQRSDAATGVAEAKKALALAERDVAQVPALGDGISERERLERQQSVEVARESLKQAEAALTTIAGGVTVAIRAPLSGRLGPATARPGDQVEAGDPLFRVTDPSALWMEARVPERLAVGLSEGAPAEVLSVAMPGRTLHAVVLDAGQQADPATGTVLVTLAVQDENTGLRPGMGGSAWIGTGAKRDVLVVPDGAVVDSNGATLAFVKTGPESFEMRELQLGGRAGTAWEVLIGLKPGERVVTEGTYTLRSLAGR